MGKPGRMLVNRRSLVTSHTPTRDTGTVTNDGAPVVLIRGWSLAGGEIARYSARHGGKHIARTVFVAPTTPYAVKTTDNPEALPLRPARSACSEGTRHRRR